MGKTNGATPHSNKKDQQPLGTVQEKAAVCPLATHPSTTQKDQLSTAALTEVKSNITGSHTKKKNQQPQDAAPEKTAACPMVGVASCTNSHKQVDQTDIEKVGHPLTAVPDLERTGIRSSPRLAKRVRSNDDQVGTDNFL